MLQHSRSIWQDGNGKLYLVVFGIRGDGTYRPDVNIASDRVEEGIYQPDSVYVHAPEHEVVETESMRLIDKNTGLEVLKEVCVVDKLFLMPYKEKAHPYTDINEIKAKKSPSELSDWEEARKYYFEAGGVESMLGPREEADWYWRRAAKLAKRDVDRAERRIEEVLEQLESQTKAYNRTKCCVASHDGDVDEEGNVWWKWNE